MKLILVLSQSTSSLDKSATVRGSVTIYGLSGASVLTTDGIETPFITIGLYFSVVIASADNSSSALEGELSTGMSCLISSSSLKGFISSIICN